jgi:hypothetical protein
MYWNNCPFSSIAQLIRTVNHSHAFPAEEVRFRIRRYPGITVEPVLTDDRSIEVYVDGNRGAPIITLCPVPTL